VDYRIQSCSRYRPTRGENWRLPVRVDVRTVVRALTIGTTGAWAAISVSTWRQASPAAASVACARSIASSAP
jgi:hypothetical protein